MKTGMFHILYKKQGREKFFSEKLYRFSGDHVTVVRELCVEKRDRPTIETCIVRTRKGDLAKLTRHGNHWQRYAELVEELA